MKERLEYTGRAYVRPLERGIVLLDRDSPDELEAVLAAGYYEVRLAFERLENDAVVDERDQPER